MRKERMAPRAWRKATREEFFLISPRFSILYALRHALCSLRHDAVSSPIIIDISRSFHE
jgi:hypothetical protein